MDIALSTILVGPLILNSIGTFYNYYLFDRYIRPILLGHILAEYWYRFWPEKNCYSAQWSTDTAYFAIDRRQLIGYGNNRLQWPSADPLKALRK